MNQGLDFLAFVILWTARGSLVGRIATWSLVVTRLALRLHIAFRLLGESSH